MYLFDNEQAQASEIAEGLNISKQHVSKIVAGFIQAGYISEAPSDKDKRASVISLTETGKRYLADHFEASNCTFEALVSRMERQESARFLQAMKDISDLISKYTEK